MAEEPESGTLKSGSKLLEVINVLQELNGASVSEVSDYLDVGKGHIHKYLKTLETNGYADNSNGVYELSFKFISHSEHVKMNDYLCTVGESRVQELADEVEDVVKLSVKNRNKSIVVASENDLNLFQDRYMPGQESYLHQSAPGKAILAKLPDEDIREYIRTTGLPSREPPTITDEKTLWEQIESIREHDYAISLGEWDSRVNGIGAAVHTENSGTIVAINVLGPATRLTHDKLIEEYSGRLLQITSQMNLKVSEVSDE
jgi:DNA-binding IclR family transcriptional regulator